MYIVLLIDFRHLPAGEDVVVSLKCIRGSVLDLYSSEIERKNSISLLSILQIAIDSKAMCNKDQYKAHSVGHSKLNRLLAHLLGLPICGTSSPCKSNERQKVHGSDRKRYHSLLNSLSISSSEFNEIVRLDILIFRQDELKPDGHKNVINSFLAGF